MLKWIIIKRDKMFAIRFTNGFDEYDGDRSKYYGPYADLETCLAEIPHIVRQILKDIDFEDQYGPDEEEYDSEKDPADVVKEYDDRHKNLFPYCTEKAMYGIVQETVDQFYITEETLLKMLKEHKYYKPESYCSFEIIEINKFEHNS